MVVVRLIDRRIFEFGPACDREGVIGSDDGYHVGCFYVSVGCLGSFGDSGSAWLL